MTNEKEMNDEITKYTRAKSIEIFKKGPKRIEVKFYKDGFSILVIEPYNKTEMTLLLIDDAILTGAILTLRDRVCQLFCSEFEAELGDIVNRKVRLLSPEFNNQEFSISYGFTYLDK